MKSFKLNLRHFFLFFSKVHVSQQTLALLKDEYNYENGTDVAKNDKMLNENNIKTFLITPTFDTEATVCKNILNDKILYLIYFKFQFAFRVNEYD